MADRILWRLQWSLMFVVMVQVTIVSSKVHISRSRMNMLSSKRFYGLNQFLLRTHRRENLRHISDGNHISGGNIPANLMANKYSYLKYAPKKRNIRRKKLLKKLGKDFNSKWMSIDEPDNEHDVTRTGKGRLFTPDYKLVSELENLNFTLIDGNEATELKPQVRKTLEMWLLQFSSCHVTYEWYDLGRLFWPRWVRKGSCDDKSPCSWPPGMFCVPAESHNIYLLRWHCLTPRHQRRLSAIKESVPEGQHLQRRHMKCRWRKVPYPVTGECFCSC